MKTYRSLPRFLLDYVRHLSYDGTSNIRALYHEVLYRSNFRVREPLFFYAYYTDKSKYLLKLLTPEDTADFYSLCSHLAEGTVKEMPREYWKVLDAFEVNKNLPNIRKSIHLARKQQIAGLMPSKHVNSRELRRAISAKHPVSRFSYDECGTALEYLRNLKV